jgi:hypothetical protein
MFVIELKTHRVQIADIPPQPYGDTSAFLQILTSSGVTPIRVPPRSPNLNAYAERFVRSIKEECLNRVVVLGECHLRHDGPTGLKRAQRRNRARRLTAMEQAGIDLGKRKSQIAIITGAGELVEKRVRTERERLRQFFAGRAKARIVIEASTISEKLSGIHYAMWRNGSIHGELNSRARPLRAVTGASEF